MTYEDTTHNLLTTISDGVTVTNTYDATDNTLTSNTTADGENKWSSYSDDNNFMRPASITSRAGTMTPALGGLLMRMKRNTPR